MKKRISISLFLLVIFCVAPILGQQKNGLVSESIKFANLKIPAEKRERFLSNFFRPLLSDSGSVRFDEQSKTFVFNDTPSRIEFIKRVRNVLDGSGLQAKDFFVKAGSDKKSVTETAHVGVLTPKIGCDVGEEFAFSQRNLKKTLLMKTIEATKVQFKWVATGMFHSGLELSGSRKRVELAKKFITLFDGNDIL